MMWNYQTENHLSVDVLGTSDIAFHEIWFVLLLHKHPAIVNLLIRECQYTYFLCHPALRTAREKYTHANQINNPYAQASSDTRKDSRQRKERSTKIWHPHRGPADQALPSTLDDLKRLARWTLDASQWSEVVICWIFKKQPSDLQFPVNLMSHPAGHPAIILTAPPQVLGLLSRKRLSSSAERGTHRHKHPKMTEILNC